jgi:hypothetical protein
MSILQSQFSPSPSQKRENTIEVNLQDFEQFFNTMDPFTISREGIVEASLTIAGWVAMWHPMDICLYGWWPLRRAGKVYRKLSTIPVEVRDPNSSSAPQARATVADSIT